MEGSHRVPLGAAGRAGGRGGGGLGLKCSGHAEGLEQGTVLQVLLHPGNAPGQHQWQNPLRPPLLVAPLSLLN